MKSLTKYSLLFLVVLVSLVLAQSIYDPLYVFKQANSYAMSYDIKGLSVLLAYLGGYILVGFSLFLMLRVKSRVIFFLFIVLFFLLYSIDFFMQLLGTSYGFSYNEFILAVHEAGNINNLLNYLDYVVYALIVSFVFSAFFVVLRVKFIDKFYASTIVIPAVVLAFLGTAVPVYTNDYITHKVYPSFTKIPIISLVYLRHRPQVKERLLDLSIVPKKSSDFKNIIWVIDESVTGTYLSVNGYDKKTTPYLDDLSKTNKMVNFGVVNAVSNCSSSSNLALRIGLNPSVFPDFDKNMYDLPTIFQYAKRAGYTTWLLDSQAPKDYLQNYISLYDKKHIDNFLTLDNDTVPFMRDELMLKKMEDLTKSGDKNFIVAIKFGAHWPYILDYNPSNTVFKPTIETTYGMSHKNKERQVNTYANAILYSTDGYLKELVSKSDLSESIIFYTSDHGQNILETDVKITHCNTENVIKNEVAVPLFVFHDKAKELFPINKDEPYYSQIQMFPTTLSLLGYGEDVSKKYGRTLWENFKKSDDREFFIYVTGKIQVYK